MRDQRSEIEELWCKTNLSALERALFDAYFRIQDDEQLTSKVLIKHKDYAASPRAKLRRMQPVLDLIAKRESIIEERIELELLQKDPDRLKGRGATKQLMKEEKMNCRITKEHPKIMSILEEMLRQWYVKNKPDAEEGQAMFDSNLGHFMYRLVLLANHPMAGRGMANAQRTKLGGASSQRSRRAHCFLYCQRPI